MATVKKKEVVPVSISAPNLVTIKVRLTGNAPLMISKFSEKAKLQMEQKMDGTTKAGSRSAREKRNYAEEMIAAEHVSLDGWYGFSCAGLRSAMISACRLVNFTMTRAKISLFVPAQGYDRGDSMPLFRIYGEPIRNDAAVRNSNGSTDIRIRPLWQKWYAEPEIMFDGDQFTISDVVNLLKRAGLQIGLGEGRPDSRNSAGIGFGTFEVSDAGKKAK